MSEREVMRELEDARIDPPEPEPAKHCAVCGEGLYLGDHYFFVEGEPICDECAENMFGCYIVEYDYFCGKEK